MASFHHSLGTVAVVIVVILCVLLYVYMYSTQKQPTSVEEEPGSKPVLFSAQSQQFWGIFAAITMFLCD